MSAYGKLNEVFQKYKNQKQKMPKNASHENTRDIVLFSKQSLLIFAVIAALGFSTIVSADTFDQKINRLAKENQRHSAHQDQLGAQAASLSEQIKKLQGQIDAKQAAINNDKAQVAKLKVQIAKAEEELAKERKILGESIRTMYLEGDISTLEMLATSKNLSDYFDRQQYRESVQNKIKSTLDKITQLKLDLSTKKTKTEAIIKEQQTLQNELVSQRAQKNRLLHLNESQQNELESSIRSNNSKIAKLRAAQAAANRQLNGGGGVSAGDPGHGGYPSVWDRAPQDSMLDNWGMYNRECVSYTAWKVYQTFGYMPYWGGHGNANEWPGNARADGIPTGSKPKRHSVAIWNVGFYGHAMWVEQVNGDGSIWVSQYNYDYNGHYSEMYISPSMARSLTYIYFR